MGWNRKLSLIFFLVAMATAAYFLRSLVPTVLEEYRTAAEFGEAWGYVYLAVAGGGALAFLTLAVWTIWSLTSNTRSKAKRRASQSRTPNQMSEGEKNAEIAAHLETGRSWTEDGSLTPEAREKLRRSLEEVEAKRERQKLEIVAFGTISSGKSSLLNALAGRDVFKTEVRGGTTVTRNEIPWPDKDQVTLVDTPGLGEVHGAEREELAKQCARDADLVLLVTDGPLRDFEMELLEILATMEKPILVCLNKEDWFRPGDRDLLLEQIAGQVSRFVTRENVVSLRAKPTTRIRTRVLANGSELDEEVEVPPDISVLARRMQAIVEHDGRDMLLANLLLQARGLAAEAKAEVQTELDVRARQIVDRSMWQAGAAAALSPFPVVDVAAGLGITSHMVVQLARVYKQKIDLDTASRLISELGKQLVSVAGANLAAPFAASGIASLLKTVPVAGTISGGVLQGLVQVLVTRWIGGVFIEYFRNEMREEATDWASLARAQWAKVTQREELTRLVTAGIARLGGRKS